MPTTPTQPIAASPQSPQVVLKPIKVFHPVFSENPDDHWRDGFQAGDIQIWPHGKHWIAKKHGPTGGPEHPYSPKMETPEAALAFLQMPIEEQLAAKAKIKQTATQSRASLAPEARYTWYCDFLSRAGVSPRPFDEWRAMQPQDEPERYRADENRGHIAIDLDGTLARWEPNQGLWRIGEPIPEMVTRVKGWLSEGRDVRIFTARVYGPDAESQRRLIDQWCRQYIGRTLPVTAQKDPGMYEFWDDRAIQVLRNTGRPVGRYGMTAQEIDEAVKDWSPPTEAQREAGNYQKPTIPWKGLTIKIETPRGQRRKPEYPELPCHYGYIARLGNQAAPEARDDDKVDCFVGPELSSDLVVVIDQETKSGRFDEWKVVVGCTNQQDALDLYRRAYSPGWRVGPATSMTVEQFKAWLDDMPSRGRIAPQVSRYTADGTPERYAQSAPAMNRYYRIQPAGKTSDHLSESSAGERTNLHVFESPLYAIHAQEHPTVYGDEVVEIEAPGHQDNHDVEGVAIDPTRARVTRRWSLDDFPKAVYPFIAPDLDELAAGVPMAYADHPGWYIARNIEKHYGDLDARDRANERQIPVEHEAPERYARHKSQAGQRTLHFESAAPTGARKWTAADEAKHPRDETGEFAPKDTVTAESKPAEKPQADETLAEHVANLHDAMQERLQAGKQFLARHDGKPLWIPSGDHIRVSPDQQTIEHTDPQGRWVRADLAQLDHWADKANLQPFTGPEGILTKQENPDAGPTAPGTSDRESTREAPAPTDQPGDDRAVEGDGPAGPGEGRDAGEAREPERLKGGRADQRPDSDFDPEALAKGIKVESEHTSDPEQAKEIAKDHLSERADYYDQLAQIEDQPINQPHRPPEPEVPEVDDSEPPEEYLAHEPPGDLGERIRDGDATAADEVMRRLDEQYPEGATGEKADRARAVRKKLVEDFGEKIGGARKDMARPLGPRGSSKKLDDDRPGWARRYHVGQITKSNRKEEEGQWAVYDTKHKNWHGQPRQIGVFPTKEEADRSIPLAEVARSHSVYAARKQDGTEEFAIVRNVSDRKHPVVRGGFKSRDEAMKYMALHTEEIIEHQFPRYEQYQYLDHVQREGGKPRSGNTTPADFHQEFGFRGGEFGNWQSGRDGQEALNHAHGALLDLADVLGVEPAGISLGGDLAIAFGARGTGGKDAARAHYEPGARVINLTKMRGAGTLAHEFAHALDNYFARQAKQPGERYGKYEWVTEGLPHRHNLRPEVADAWTNLVKSMMARETEQAVDPERVKKQQQAHWDHVKTRLQSLETSMAGDKQYNKRHKDFTPDQQAEWDATKAAILSGQAGDRQFVAGKSRFGGYETYANLAKLNQLYKARTGRSFHTAQEGSPGRDLFWSIQNSLDAEQKIKEAQAGKTETKKQATNYYKAARDLDETRASSYYTVPTEMLARAFEAYCYDKLAAEGRRSDYLVGKAENKFYQMFDMAPFPEGEERQAINAAFDRLFSTMKQRPREDEKGQHVELYRADPLHRLARTLYGAWYDRAGRP